MNELTRSSRHSSLSNCNLIIAGAATIPTIWSTIQSIFFNSTTDAEKPIKEPEIPLISRTVISSIDHAKPSSNFFVLCFDDQVRFEMRYDLCTGLKEGDWEGMSGNEKFSLKRYFIECQPCYTLKIKLIKETTKAVQNIAREMGFKHSHQVSINIKDGSIGIDQYNEIYMPQRFAFDLIGLCSKDEKNKSSGVIAHEISHRIFNHQEHESILHWKLLRDFTYLKHTDLEGKKYLKFERTGENRYSKILNLTTPNNILTCEWSDRDLLIEIYRMHEIEADMHTLQVPYLARGLRDFFNEQIYFKPSNNNLNCQFLGNDGKCIAFHPPMKVRRDYMTENLCHYYPQLNQDICSSTRVGSGL